MLKIQNRKVKKNILKITIIELQVDCIKDYKILNNTRKMVWWIKKYMLFSQIWTMSKRNEIFEAESSLKKNNRG